jgi:succinate-semialdehyde dehydrogenase/glutarate-semialdehyde dehydrogenase
MPWNFPFWQVFRFAAPSLMAGNAALLKHASNVSGCALAIENIFHKAGLPKDLFRTLLIGSDKVSTVIENENINAVTLTGSTKAGKAVASKCGEMLKKCVLELGGSDAYLVFEDADIEYAAEICAKSRLLNAGQSCIAAKRFIINEKIFEEFLHYFKLYMEKPVIGDPLLNNTDLGPLARIDLRDELHEKVKLSITKGAELIAGGKIPEREGAFYYPTILINVIPGMPAYDEEMFGPVASVIKVKDNNEAVKIANDSIFGLGSAIFSGNIDNAESIASNKIEAGSCFVNDFVRSDPRLPFGGIKESGYGRELSAYGIKEFVNIKTIYVK